MDVKARAAQNTEPDKHVVLWENETTRIVVMHVTREIPEETHAHVTQVTRVEYGSGYAVINGKRTAPLHADDVIVIAPGTRHRIVATGNNFRLSLIYTKPRACDPWE